MSNNSDWWSRQLGNRPQQPPQQYQPQPPQYPQPPQQYQPYPPQYPQQPPVYPPPQFQQPPVYPPQQYPPQPYPPQAYPPQQYQQPYPPQAYPPQPYPGVPGQKLSEAQGFENKPPASYSAHDRCPECSSGNYVKTGKTPPSQAGPGQDVFRCYDCGYPVKQTTSGMSGISSGNQGGPVGKAIQVATGGWNPQGIIGRI